MTPSVAKLKTKFELDQTAGGSKFYRIVHDKKEHEKEITSAAFKMGGLKENQIENENEQGKRKYDGDSSTSSPEPANLTKNQLKKMKKKARKKWKKFLLEQSSESSPDSSPDKVNDEPDAFFDATSKDTPEES